MNELLIKFLKEKNCYELFIANAKKAFPRESEEYLSLNFNSIGEAFEWDRTPEGDAFWRELNNEFYNYIEG